MSCMTWSSKTWTQVNMIVKTWQPPQIWNPAFFFQDLAVPQVLKCYIFLQPHVPKPWQWLLYSRLGFPSLETFRGKAFQHYRPLPEYVFHDLVFQDMNTFGTYFFKTWQPQFWNLAPFFKTWNPKFWNVHFLQFHVPKSWQWLHYSRLGFPTLETFWAKEFQQYK